MGSGVMMRENRCSGGACDVAGMSYLGDVRVISCGGDVTNSTCFSPRSDRRGPVDGHIVEQ